VSSSRALKWFVLLLLPLTLAWKLAVRPGDSADVEINHQLKIVDFLTKQHFKVAMAERVQQGQPFLQATAGACRILIVDSPAIGSDRDLVRRLVTDSDRVFVVFRGKVYPEQPTSLTVFDFLWTRFQRELGLRASAAPVLAVIAPPICDAERLPWADLG
jgi:hypothetical protein